MGGGGSWPLPNAMCLTVRSRLSSSPLRSPPTPGSDAYVLNIAIRALQRKLYTLYMIWTDLPNYIKRLFEEGV